MTPVNECKVRTVYDSIAYERYIQRSITITYARPLYNFSIKARKIVSKLQTNQRFAYVDNSVTIINESSATIKGVQRQQRSQM